MGERDGGGDKDSTIGHTPPKNTLTTLVNNSTLVVDIHILVFMTKP